MIIDYEIQDLKVDIENNIIDSLSANLNINLMVYLNVFRGSIYNIHRSISLAFKQYMNLNDNLDWGTRI
jgi:hypothetical protein